MQGIADIPAWMESAWGINETTAQLILSVALIFAILLPTLYLTKNQTVHIIMFVLAECLLAGLGWMPFWILIVTVVAMSMAVAALGSKAITGE